ncbi:tubby-related protein 4-like [Tubulanus polymorphus]|uniref:tubby-related protein 4-like n=1 Tax=Tubulanus polymorphus TaxID=672921 RepID=UPI003DA50A17
MHIHLEQLTPTRSDCTIQTLSWMGKVPDGGAPEQDGWKLNRQHYYQEGWLAAGNIKGIVSATFTTCHCKTSFEMPLRTNFNLRGHRNEIILVKWNEPYQKLATCDANGVIFVWIKHEGRWSVELINDRNSPVTDFAWSHDGRMALICYQDGFVLVGSVAGQRYWSTMLNLENTTITCGVWVPNDTKVLIGISDGHVIVISSTGAMIGQESVLEGSEITSMSWSCEKFKMDESTADDKDELKDDNDGYLLAVSFKQGLIYLMLSYDDVCPRIIDTRLTGVKMEWSNDGAALAVGGFIRLPNLECNNSLQFYTPAGDLCYTQPIPSQGKPLTALTWGHNDKRLFIATGCYIHTAWVTKNIVMLQFLCSKLINRYMPDEASIKKTPLPQALMDQVSALYVPTVKGYIPNPFKLREFVSLPPINNERLHCTMIRHGEENSGGYYTLYLEYLGGLIPLLRGKRASKIRPEFVIYDPKIKSNQKTDIFASSSSSCETDSDCELPADGGCGSPRMRRRRRFKICRNERIEQKTYKTVDELLYDDNLPENHKLVEVTSNIWGTKFKIHGLASYLPVDLGQVVYKTSLLHLQPRQMTVTITELSHDMQHQPRDMNFSPHSFSEDEDEDQGQTAPITNGTNRPNFLSADNVIPIAPEITQSPIGIPSPGFVSGPVVVENHAAFTCESDNTLTTPSIVDLKRSSTSEYSLRHRLLLTKHENSDVQPSTSAVATATPSIEQTENDIVDDDELNLETLKQLEKTVEKVVKYKSRPKSSIGGAPKNCLKTQGKSRSLEEIFIDLRKGKKSAENSPKHATPNDSYLCVKRGSLDSREPEGFNSSIIHPRPQSTSLPATPTKLARKRLNRTDVIGKHKIQSPLFHRRWKNVKNIVESSDEEYLCSGDEIMTYSHNYKDLETFQKAQLRLKIRKNRRSVDRGMAGMKQFVMHNKAPLWNENSQVYQLDFGGRVTQESAKNFQIEFRGKQVRFNHVMQFGRIDSNAYTLDFQYPFTAIQAFAVALANVTQRLK